MCTPKDKGGTGLRRIQPMNRALFCKWLWQFGQKEKSLWRQVLGAKYGETGGLDELWGEMERMDDGLQLVSNLLNHSH